MHNQRLLTHYTAEIAAPTGLNLINCSKNAKGVINAIIILKTWICFIDMKPLVDLVLIGYEN